MGSWPRTTSTTSGACRRSGGTSSRMKSYVAQRLGIAILTLVGMSIVIFALLRLAPGDIVDILFSTAGYVNESEKQALLKELGMDRPYWVQYLDWMRQILSGDLGKSYRFDIPAWEVIPSLTYVSPRDNFRAHAIQFALPALAVGYRSSALIMRITRSSLLEVMREDYIRTAWAKGQAERVVIWRHALKNAMLPVVTIIGIEFAFLIGGLVVTETVFNLPGVARFLVQAILWRDYPVVQNLVMFIAIVVILSNLFVDMLYGVLDPRVRYGS